MKKTKIYSYKLWVFLPHVKVLLPEAARDVKKLMAAERIFQKGSKQSNRLLSKDDRGIRQKAISILVTR